MEWGRNKLKLPERNTFLLMQISSRHEQRLEKVDRVERLTGKKGLAKEETNVVEVRQTAFVTSYGSILRRGTRFFHDIVNIGAYQCIDVFGALVTQLPHFPHRSTEHPCQSPAMFLTAPENTRVTCSRANFTTLKRGVTLNNVPFTGFKVCAQFFGLAPCSDLDHMF